MNKTRTLEPVRCAALAALLTCSAAAQAEDTWTGAHMAVIASSSRQVIGGNTVKADGTFGSNASKESADVHDGAAGLGLLVGTRRRLSSGVIAGVEADLAWLDHRARQNSLIDSGLYEGQPSAVMRYDTRWLATVRLSAGWPVGPALLYATAGLALAGEKVSRTQQQANVATGRTDPAFTETERTTRVGHVVGIGLQWRLSGAWSLRGEYLHARFPNASTRFPDARGGAQASFSSVQGRVADSRASLNTVRFGLSRTFDGLW